jgi:2-polyprenyl-3-methyl-5-hydroxy-6-metoxy-1,4-benzoquinol methylase
MTQISRCWCGNEQLEPFSEEYLRCPSCESLVLIQRPADLFPKNGEEQAYYGKEYWLSHQEHDLKLPSIVSRARTDLVDRVPYWLNKVLQHRLPPARALELGCANGSLVAMLRQLGYDASGLELSAWVVDFARQTFNVPMYLGPVEEQEIEPHSLDLLMLMDVIEHLPDPLATMRTALGSLRPGGLVILQTPAYPAGTSFLELSAADHPFLKMLIPGDHLYLFSQAALRQLLLACGLEFTLEEPALFPYDQFLFASSAPIANHTAAEILASLEEKPERRLALAHLDLYQRLAQIEKLYVQADLDRSARLEQLNKISRQRDEAEADRSARLKRMNELGLQLAAAETDRAARLERIIELSQQLEAAEADRAARLAVIESLGSQLQELDLEKENLSHQLDEYHQALSQYQRRYELWEKIAGKTIKTANLPAQPAENAATAELPALKRIVIDLTPVRPGGENGGMKLAALDLVKRFSRDIAPEVEFILLTSSDAHDTLAHLDAVNVRRLCVNQVDAARAVPTNALPAARVKSKRPFHRQISHAIARGLEIILPARVFRTIYQHYRGQIQAPRAHDLIRSLQADLVFCPFTGIFHYAPGIPTVVIVADLQYLYYPQFFTQEQNYHSDLNFRKVCREAALLSV